MVPRTVLASEAHKFEDMLHLAPATGHRLAMNSHITPALFSREHNSSRQLLHSQGTFIVLSQKLRSILIKLHLKINEGVSSIGSDASTKLS